MKLTYAILLSFFSLILVSKVNAQEVDLFMDFEGGLRIPRTLRNFHEELAEQIPFENVETTGNFNNNYGFAIGFRFNKNASIFFNNRVSGAKSSVADYSGFIRLTNELNAYTFGLEYEILLKEFEKGKVNFGVKGLVTSSKLILNSESRILNTVQNENVEFKSLDFGGAFGINYEYPLGFITFRAHFDFNLYYGGKLKLKDDNSGGFLTNQNGNKITTSRTGLIGGIGFLLPLSK